MVMKHITPAQLLASAYKHLDQPYMNMRSAQDCRDDSHHLTLARVINGSPTVVKLRAVGFHLALTSSYGSAGPRR